MGGKHEKEEMDKKENRQPQKKASRIGQLPIFFSSYRFSWDNVPGDDSERLKNFLKDDFDIDWVDDATITKSDDGMTIRIFTDEHSSEITMGENKESATLKTRVIETHNLKVKKEEDKLNVYFLSVFKPVVNMLQEIPVLKEVIQGFKEINKKHPTATSIFKKSLITLFWTFIGVVLTLFATDYYHEYSEQKEDIIKPTKILHSMTTEDNGYIRIWEPCTSRRAPKNGWLVVENPFYKLNINLDHSYYLIFDKLRDKDILVYDDTVKAGSVTLAGCDLGFGDNDLSNPIHYATTAIHDTDGIEYEISYEDRNSGFVLIDTEGWDTRQKDAGEGYDVEADVLFGIFSNKPYFINAVELSNLQKMGLACQKPFKNPDEIVQTWFIIDEYRYTRMKGGDNSNADMWDPPLLYNITPINRTERKPWHVGSTSFSKMFPEHILLGAKYNGGIIFSLPEGIFRFDDSLGVYGD